MKKRKILFYLPGIIILVILLIYLLFIIVQHEVRQDFEELRESSRTLPTESEENLERQSFTLDPDNTHFYWGLHFDSRVKNMKINGLSPTEVIPVTLDGEQAYFWYYEDLGFDVLDVNAAEPVVVFYEKGTQAD